MFDIERWQEIFEAISKNKLRTFLTGVSVSSGIFILIILLGIGEGMQRGTKKQFEKDAAAKIRFNGRRTSVNYKGLNKGRRIELTMDDYRYAENSYADHLEYKSASLNISNGLVSYKNESGSYPAIGVMPNMYFLENAKLNIGRYLSERDMELSRKVVVIGIQVAKDLFENYKDAIGKQITINEMLFTVIGIYSDPGGEREESFMYIPHTTATNISQRGIDAGGFVFTLNPEESFETANNKASKFINQYKRYLRKKHKISPRDEKAIFSQNALLNAQKFFEISIMMKFFFWGIGILTLIAGIVGVSNIMLIIVKERTKEIGIRKALGAQPNSIIGMILHEAIFITTISGFIGLFFALLTLEIVGPKIDSSFIVNPSVDFNIAIITVILLIIAGAIAGFVPANHAARIKPIIALRDE